MERYLKFNIQSDQVCATPGNVYFKIRDKFSDGEYTEVFASEERFPLLLKVIQSEEDLSKSLNFDSYGQYFTKIITDTQDQYGFIHELDMNVFLEKKSSELSWPSKIKDLSSEWHEDTDLQKTFPLIENFISDKTEKELWSLYEMWEIVHGEIIDLSHFNLKDYSYGGWALDGYYMEDPHAFIGFTNITGVEIELYDGDSTSKISEDELRDMLSSQYADQADQLDSLEPATLIDRGILRDATILHKRIKSRARYQKIIIYICLGSAYIAWSNGLFG